MKKMIMFLAVLHFTAIAYCVPVEMVHIPFSRTPVPDRQEISGNPLQIDRTAAGWLLTIPKDGRTELRLPHSPWKRSLPEGIVLRARSLQGKAFVKLRLVDGKGHWFVTPGQWITPESDRIVFHIEGLGGNGPRCRLMGITIDPAEAGVKLLFDRLGFIYDKPESEALQLSADTAGGMLPVFNSESGAPLRFVVRNGSPEAVKRREKFSFEGLGGSVYEFEHDVDLPPWGEESFTPSNLPSRFGVWYGKPEPDGSRVMFAWLPENGLAEPGNPEFEFAVDNHWINPAVIEAMRFLGIRAIRSIVGWERIQPSSGDDWNFPVFDARIDALDAAGIKMRESLVFTPKWAAVSNPENRPYPRNRQPRSEAWENYVRAMAKRYGNRVEFFEIWNEPDLPGFVDFPVEEYIELCRIARRVIREESPNCKIASGGFATMSPSLLAGKPAKFHEQVLREAKDTFDIHSYHEHGYFPHFQRMVDGEFLPLRKREGITVPWIASETAMHSAKGADIAQADCLFKKFLFTWARGAVSYTWYGLVNNGYDLNYSEDNFGILDRFMSPKYIFGVYAALTRHYREARFTGQLKAEGRPWLFRFRTPRGVLLANWSLDPSGGVALYAAYGNGKTAELLDLDGNSSTLPCRDGAALFPVGPTGSTLAFIGASQIDSVEAVARIILPDAIGLDKKESGTLTIKNPWRRTVKCMMEPQKASGMELSGLPSSRILKPGEKLELPFSVVCRTRTEQLTIDLKFDHEPELAVSVPLNFAMISPDSVFSGRKPDFVLNRYQQIESIFEFDPSTAASLWSGPDDLSAEVWIGRRDDRFELLAKVLDDKHRASPQADQLWQGDSIQFALDFSGQNGYFELGGGLNASGKAEAGCWIVPQGFQVETVRQAINIKIEREGKVLIYRMSVPLSALGVSAEKLRNGFRFNMLVNDNDDGKIRKCFIRLAPGIGSGAQAMGYSPLVVCQ